MKSIRLLTVIIILSFSFMIQSQDRKPMLTIPVSVSQDSRIINLEAGIDSLATDSIDNFLGEEELPPLPPAGTFDARFIGENIGIDIGNGLLKDYRHGNDNSLIEIVFHLSVKKGGSSDIIISWEFPDDVSGNLQDFFNGIIVNHKMSGSGSYILTTPNISELKLTIVYEPITSVISQNNALPGFILHQNYPNPFNSSTRIKYEVFDALSNVILKIYDSLGKEVITLTNQYLTPGKYETEFNPVNLASGIYFCRLVCGQYVSTKKMILNK